jgi:hypothetical protein
MALWNAFGFSGNILAWAAPVMTSRPALSVSLRVSTLSIIGRFDPG